MKITKKQEKIATLKAEYPNERIGFFDEAENRWEIHYPHGDKIMRHPNKLNERMLEKMFKNKD